MAATNLDTTKVKAEFNDIKAGAFVAFDGTDGAEYTVKNNDSKTIIILQNTDSSNAETVTIKKPTNPATGVGTAFGDKAVSVAASGTAVAVVESMRYMDGLTGKVKLTGSADVKALVVEVK